MVKVVLFVLISVLFLFILNRIFRRKEYGSSQKYVHGLRPKFVTECPPLTGKSIINSDCFLYPEEEEPLDCADSLEETGDSPEEICLDDEDLLEEESEESKAAYESLKVMSLPS